MPRCSRRAHPRADRKDDGHETHGRDRGGARAVRRGAARGAVLRAEQGAVPVLRLPHHPDRALRSLLLSGRAGGGTRRGAHRRALVRPAIAGAASPVPGPEAHHFLRVAVRLPADQHHFGRRRRGDGRLHRVLQAPHGAAVHGCLRRAGARGRPRNGAPVPVRRVQPGPHRRRHPDLREHQPAVVVHGRHGGVSLGRTDRQPHRHVAAGRFGGGHLPTLQQLSYDEVFPYYFGHAIWAYVGEKWGDEAVGQILQASTSAGVEGAFKRIIGVSLDELISGWRDAVQTTYLPQLADHYRARRIAQPLLTRKRSEGTLHIAPALAPDGRQIAYFSEKNSFFVDLYLADAETGKVLRRLVKSTLSSNYESLRFINSAGSFSPDGRYFAIAAKHRDRDDLVILDVKKDQEVRRIPLPLNGLTTPAWSPDGRQIVFTGYDGGLSDLFVVNADGSGLHRLTNDKYADLQPSWAPDGKTIAFATDRGPKTDFDALKFGNMRIALFHL